MSSGIRAVWAGWVALGGSILLFALHPWLLDRAEYSLLDARFRLRGPVPVTSPVTVVAIDAASLDEFGRWPWRRSLLADLVDRLVEAGEGAPFELRHAGLKALASLRLEKGYRPVSLGFPLF